MNPSPASIDIMTFAMDPHYLGLDFLSAAQRSILKAIYGEEMTREEELVFLEMTEGRRADPKGYTDIVIVAGTRGGKTSLMTVPFTFECVRWANALKDMLQPGQVAKAILIAQDKKGAAEARNYIEGYLETLEENGHEVLARTFGQSKAIVGDSIRLNWPLEIVIYPCTKMSVRGATGLCFLGDEIAWWKSEEGQYNQDTQVMKAVRSRFATLSSLRPRKFMISSPNEKYGILHEEWKARDRSKSLVVHAPAWTMNPPVREGDEVMPCGKVRCKHPHLSQEFLDAEEAKNPEDFQQEYGAVFSDGVGGGNLFIPAQVVENCIDRGRLDHAPRAGVEYVGWMDAAFKRDRFAFGIGHAESEGERVKVVVDLMRTWTPIHRKGYKTKPIDEDEVLQEIAGLLTLFGLDTVNGDQFADVPLRNKLSTLGIYLAVTTTTKAEKSEAMKNLRGAMRAGLVELPDDPATIKDIKGLVARKTSPGHYVVEAPRNRVGSYDDAATVVSRLILRFLPMDRNIDLEAINARAAYMRTGPPGEDYRIPEDQPEFGGGLMEALY